MRICPNLPSYENTNYFSFLFIIIVYIRTLVGIVYILFIFISFYSDPNRPEKQESVHGGRVTNRFINLEWPKYDLEDQKYLHIGKKFLSGVRKEEALK